MKDIVSLRALAGFEPETYFRALIAVARADGSISDDEMSFLEDQSAMMSVELRPLLDASACASKEAFSTASLMTKRMVIRDCIALARLDGTYDDAERNRIGELAHESGLSASDVDEIEKWLQDYWEVMDRAEVLFSAAEE